MIDPHLSRRAFTGAAAAFVAAPYVLAQSRTEVARPVLGTGAHVYEAIHDWVTPPAGLAWGDTHGLAQDAQGRIYIAHTVNGSSEQAHAVVVCDPDGTPITAWGDAFRGGAHGLDLRREGSDEFLYHCDTQRRLVVKTSLDGEVVWTQGVPMDSGVYVDASRYCPTNVAFAPDGDLFVGDGYGSSYIHRYGADGSYKKTICGPGAEAGQVSCPHGLWIDPRGDTPELVVADRGNRRLQYLSLDGEHRRFVTAGMRMPCDIKFRGDLMLVPDLESVVTLLDKDNHPVAHLGDGHPSGLRGSPRLRRARPG